jgi:cyclopropane-fatty-acyl-phospholipid synthase
MTMHHHRVSHPSLLPSGSPAAARAVPARCCSACSTARCTWSCPTAAGCTSAAAGHPHAALRLHDWRVFARCCARATSAWPRAISTALEHADLADLLRLLMANRDALESLVYGAWWGRLAYRLRHLLNRNTRAGSRATSTPTTTWATPFYRCGWTRA